MATEYRKIVDLIFEPQGKHDPAVSYKIKDTVMSADGSQVYFAIQDVPAGVALTNTSYWKKQIDLAASKSAMDNAAANAKTQTDNVIASAQERVDDLVEEAANSVAQMQDYTSEYSTRVHGESDVAYGNPMEIYPDEGSLLKPVTEIKVQQEGKGDPCLAGGGKNLFDPDIMLLGGYWAKTDEGIYYGRVGYLNAAFSKGIPFDHEFKENTAYTFSFKYRTETDPGAPDVDPYFTVMYTDGTGKSINVIASVDANTYVMSSDPNKTIDVIIGTYGNNSTGTMYVWNIQLEEGSLATEYTPYENIRPIIGYDALNLTRCGKNIFGGDALKDTFLKKVPNCQHDADARTIRYNAQHVSDVIIFDKFKPNTRYTIILNGLNATSYKTTNLYVVYEDGTSEGLVFTSETEYTNSVVVTKEGKTVTAIRGGWVTDWTTLKYDLCGIFEGVLTVEDFESYKGDTYTAQIGKTICCGRMDWTTGEMLVDKEIRRFSANQPPNVVEKLSSGNNRLVYYRDSNEINSATPEGLMCDIAAPGPGEKAWTVFMAYGHVYFVVPPSVTSIDREWNVIYRLAEPFTIQLTPHQILALKGKNTIYGDGDLTVEYYKPISSLVDRYNALVEATTDPFKVSGNPVTCQTIGHQELEVVTEFGPKQEGSGDPYPAGGGKNLLPFGNGDWTIASAVGFSSPYIVISKKLPANQSLVASVWFTDGTTYTEVGAVLALRDASGNTIKAPGFARGEVFTLTETEAENIAMYNVYFNDYGVSLNVGKTIAGVQLEIGTMQTAFAPYENIRPISGYDALKLTRSGKNLLANQWVQNMGLGYNRVVVMYPVEGSSATWNIPLAPGTYTLSGVETAYPYVYDENLQPDWAFSYPYGINLPYTFTLSKPMYIGVSLGTTDSSSVQLERGNVATAYKLPVLQNYAAQFDQTVYGGRIDWNKGKMTVDRGFIRAEDCAWNFGGGGYWYTENIPAKKTKGNHVLGGVISDRYRTVIANDLSTSTNIIAVDVLGRVYINNGSSSVTPVGEIAYELASPFTIQLTPKQILALQNVNTFYGDGDTITVAGRQPKHIAIEERVAALEALMLNT